MTDIHSCSLYCTRPECVLQQRDEMRDQVLADDDALRFACRVLDAGSHPPESDRAAARDGLMAIRQRMRGEV